MLVSPLPAGRTQARCGAARSLCRVCSPGFSVLRDQLFPCCSHPKVILASRRFISVCGYIRRIDLVVRDEKNPSKVA